MATKQRPFSKKGTSGELIQRMLLRRQVPSTEAILAAVRKAFPDSKATASDVSWNRWMLARIADGRRPTRKEAKRVRAAKRAAA